MQQAADFTTVPFPLCPSTLNIGSHECFHCGLPGHIGGACPNIATQLDKCKQDWRALVSRCLFTNLRNEGTYCISQISADDIAIQYDPVIYDTEGLGFEDGPNSQGNREEAHE